MGEDLQEDGRADMGHKGASKPLISFRDVSKRFDNFTALSGINLDIYPQEFFALLGPSGCGKTTLMRMLAGFEQPSSGQITMEDKDLTAVPPHHRAINMMFQSYALFPHLTVYDNIAFGLKREKIEKYEIKRRVEEMLALVQLEQFARRKPHQISGGQRQRVALARALAKKPKLLLLDEPLAALDKKLRHATQFELVDIQEQTGTTFVIVTHDQEEAMTVASRIAVMDHGHLKQIATPDQIYEAPNSRFVADFIGEITFFDGHVSAIQAETVTMAWAEGEKDICARCCENLAMGQAVIFAIRPEKLLISRTPPPDQTYNILHGHIHDIAYLGNISTYHVRLTNGQIIKAQTTNSSPIRHPPFTWEQSVYISFDDAAGFFLTS